MSEFLNRLIPAVGGVLLSVVGRNLFYRLAQSRKGISGRIASAFCQGHAGRIAQNYMIYKSNIANARISDVALQYYSDDNLHGFGDADYSLRGDGKPLLDQQRALVIPLVEDQIQKLKPKSVLELGTANGDVLAYLANHHPDIQFIGADFSIVNAVGKHSAPNLQFVKCYALDLLNEGKISGDIVFGSSTFCVFTPLELEAYYSSMSDTKAIVISEPVTFGNVHTYDEATISRHMDLYMWWHNYYGYLLNHGFAIDTYRTVPFSYSHNPNCQVVLISGHR